MGNKIPIEKSLLKQGFFFAMADWLFASSHKTLQVYWYCYRDQATLPEYWKFKRELLHKIHGLKNKMPIAPFGSKEPVEYSEKGIEIKKNQTSVRGLMGGGIYILNTTSIKNIIYQSIPQKNIDITMLYSRESNKLLFKDIKYWKRLLVNDNKNIVVYSMRIHNRKFPPSIHGIYSIGLPIKIEEIATGIRVRISNHRIVKVDFM